MGFFHRLVPPTRSMFINSYLEEPVLVVVVVVLNRILSVAVVQISGGLVWCSTGMPS